MTAKIYASGGWCLCYKPNCKVRQAIRAFFGNDSMVDNNINSVIPLHGNPLTQLAILVSEPRQVKRALALARSIESAGPPLLVVIGNDTWRAIQRAAPLGVRLERINLHLEESGEAERLASIAMQDIFREIHFPSSLGKLLHVLGNEVYLNSLIPIFKVLVALRSLIHSKTITNLLLIGGNEQSSYYPVLFAEGERPFQFLYLRSWFVNPFIYDVFKHTVQITWLETPRLIVTGVGSLRRWLIFNARLYGIFRGYLWHKLRFGCQWRLRVTSNNRGILLPLIIRTKAQFEIVRNLYLFLEKKPGIKPVIIVDHSNFPQRFILDSALRQGLISGPGCLTLCQLYRVLFKITKAWLSPPRIKGEFHFSFRNTALRLELQTLARELKPMVPDLFYRLNCVRAALEAIKKQKYRKIGPVLTTELIAYGCALHKEAMRKAQIEVPLIVLQGVAMAELPYPFWWGDLYLLSSGEFYEFALAHYESAQDRFFYVGDFKRCGDTPSTENSREALKEILVFTQPDEYEFLFKDLISELCSFLEQTTQSVLLTIKLHPRDRNRRWYRKLSREYPFVQVLNEADITELCQRATVAITATSSVLYDAHRARAPIIAFLEGYQGEVPEYVRRLATRVVFAKEELFHVLTNHAMLVREARGKYQRESKVSKRERIDGCRKVSDCLSRLIVHDNGAKT